MASALSSWPAATRRKWVLTLAFPDLKQTDRDRMLGSRLLVLLEVSQGMQGHKRFPALELSTDGGSADEWLPLDHRFEVGVVLGHALTLGAGMPAACHRCHRSCSGWALWMTAPAPMN